MPLLDLDESAEQASNVSMSLGLLLILALDRE
jgi:hypothetical protein